MYEEKITINNRDKHPIVGMLRLPEKKGSWPLVIGSHGLYSRKERFYDHWISTWKLLHEEGYGTFLFDYTNNLGESYGLFENITVGQEVSDLEDVLSYFWTKQFVQKERIGLFGHSLGGMVELITASSMHTLHALIAIAPVFNFQIVRTMQVGAEGVHAWKERGYTKMFSRSLNEEFKVNYSFYEEGISYDMACIAGKIQTPVLVVQGDQDTSVPVNHAYDLIRCLHYPNELMIVENGDHNMRMEDYQRMIANKTLLFFNQYLKGI